MGQANDLVEKHDSLCVGTQIKDWLKNWTLAISKLFYSRTPESSVVVQALNHTCEQLRRHTSTTDTYKFVFARPGGVNISKRIVQSPKTIGRVPYCY